MTPGAEAAPDSAAPTVEALSRALELHDYRRGEFGETAAHGTRVTQLALELAELAAPELLEDPQVAFGFRLHDIGMIGVPSSTLSKRGMLSPADVDEIREHPWLGERIVAPVPGLNGIAREVIANHHERWDGSGYPARPARARDSARGEGLRDRRRVRCDDTRSALPPGLDSCSRIERDRGDCRHAVRPRAGCGVPHAQVWPRSRG